MAARLLGHAITISRKLFRKMGICLQQSCSSRIGGNGGRLALSRNTQSPDLVTTDNGDVVPPSADIVVVDIEDNVPPRIPGPCAGGTMSPSSECMDGIVPSVGVYKSAMASSADNGRNSGIRPPARAARPITSFAAIPSSRNRVMLSDRWRLLSFRPFSSHSNP